MNKSILMLIFCIQIQNEVYSQISDNDSIEWCIESKFHKKKPGKESLHNQCKPWQDYACCTKQTTLTAHDITNHYNFNFNHCPNKPMSDKCRKHFVQDLCFYECEPYLKPWVVQVNRSFASQRIFNVPICSFDCNNWWDDCRDDYTCAYNWARDFKWINGTNNCPQNSICQPLYQIFTNAQEFCEKVWDNSWKFTSENKPCMRIWFNGTRGNPNRATAEWYANAMNGSYSMQTNHLFLTIILLFYLK